MGVLDRIESPGNYGTERLPIEPFLGVLMEYADGQITKQQASSILQDPPFNLSGTDLTVEVSSWVDQISAIETISGKLEYLARTKYLLAALESNVTGISASYVKTRLGF